MQKQQPRRQRRRYFFEGRYRKLARDLPQTIFYCPECKGRGCERCDGFGKLTKDSVQELIARVAMPMFKAGRRKHKFHGAGREDVDVRMLGSGRPFVFEVIDPKIPEPSLPELERVVNERNEGRLELLDLRWCDRKRVAEVKERKHPKEYGATVKVDRPASLEPLQARLGQRIEIAQNTPERVVHRRADLVRKRWIEIRELEVLEEDQFYAKVRSEHGTYIKEVVSGDGGRSTPSFSQILGAPCSCVSLDVLAMLTEDLDPV